MNCEQNNGWCGSKRWCDYKDVCANPCKAQLKTCIRDAHHYVFYVARFGNK